MYRWMEQNYQTLNRRLGWRHLKTILTIIVIFFLFNGCFYLLTQFIFYPTTTTTTEPTTISTTEETTTTIESTTEKSFELGCFFDKTNITLADGSIRPLNLLNVGEEVLVHLSSGKIQKSRVLTIFHHQRPSVRFLEIYTINKQEPLRLTPSHSILIKKNTKKESSFHYNFAYNIAIGDFVFSSELKPLRVINIKEIILYNQIISTPLTFEGNIIVNNLIASCYATYHHKFMHMLTLPLRYWYQIETFSQFNYLIVHLIDFYSKIKF
ncbi:unnamed protein product [Rotaria sordida]|uniref:Hint domain-containing protein n=1 Tax=Rotaria sordida TaxID=392033 RepID=A0A814FSY4_9BILA|nr:unnamed protein product [Rotaria sordida]CAF1361599.1 unnamed protein product [Rotaria sordida]CAF1437928.1 unnamed protein product [Rotaria sordida]CAF1441604.1 unnamed protein product [Rotaria sordida]CAF1636105.1 unnamed protein product [Rotaria sordida]